MKAIDLHSVAIIADCWLSDAIKQHKISEKQFEAEIKAAKLLRRIASKFADNEEILIDKMPF